jgi:hypothetical protein
MRGPMPSMTTKPVVVAMTDVVSVSRSSAICTMPGVNMELASGLINAIRAMMPTFVSFSFLLHVFGFSRSFLVEFNKLQRESQHRILRNMGSNLEYLSVFMVFTVAPKQRRTFVSEIRHSGGCIMV